MVIAVDHSDALLARGDSKRGWNMRKIMIVVLALPLLFAAYGMSTAKDVATKVKPGCPTASVDATKNLKLFEAKPAPSTARKGRPKERDPTPMDTSRLKKPAAGNGDCK
jgi:hypothetical protein